MSEFIYSTGKSNKKRFHEESEFVTIKINPTKGTNYVDVVNCLVDVVNDSQVGYVKNKKYKEQEHQIGQEAAVHRRARQDQRQLQVDPLRTDQHDQNRAGFSFRHLQGYAIGVAVGCRDSC